jgi:hypothetical protein
MHRLIRYEYVTNQNISSDTDHKNNEINPIEEYFNAITYIVIIFPRAVWGVK